jgi:hypothetical protein
MNQYTRLTALACTTVAALIAVSGCPLLKDLEVRFAIAKDIGPVEVEPGVLGIAGALLSAAEIDFGTTSYGASDFTSNDTRIDLVDEISVRQIVLTITSDSPVQDFDWLDSAQLYVGADFDESSSVESDEKTLIAEISLVPTGANTLSLTTYTLVNILSYVREGTVEFSWEVDGQVPPDTCRFMVHIEVRVVADAA